MADEPNDKAEPQQPEITVEVAEDNNEGQGRPTLSDEEVSKLEEPPPQDEVGRYAKTAQKRLEALRLANTEWRRRVVQAGKDVATATTLAEQLYRENQQLKQSSARSEAALIAQALERTKAQLEQAKQRAKLAYSAQNPEEIVAANEDVARYVAEADRLRLLQPAAPPKDSDPAPAATPPPPSQTQPVSEPTQAWLRKNTWFNRPGEEKMTGFAMGVHQSLEKQGITEASNPQAYFAAIDKELRETFPSRFQNGDPAPSAGRPVTVTGATRVNGAATASEKRSPRHIVLSESQVRIARRLDLTPEQYAAQLVKEENAAKERVQ